MPPEAIAEAYGTGVVFTGPPTAKGDAFVNTFGARPGDRYIPPQAGAFAIVVSISNAGPEPVTIEAVSMLSPQEQADQARGAAPRSAAPGGCPRTTVPARPEGR